MALVRARQGCATSSRVIPAGAHIDDSDPIVVSNPQYFEPLEVVEAATAVPGEKRATRPRAAKKAAKKAANI